MLNVVACWDNYFLPFMINGNAELSTLTQCLALRFSHTGIAGSAEDFTVLKITAGTAAITPLLILFLVLQGC